MLSSSCRADCFLTEMRWRPGSHRSPGAANSTEQLPSFRNGVKGTAGEESSIWTLQLGEEISTARSLPCLGRNLSSHPEFWCKSESFNGYSSGN